MEAQHRADPFARYRTVGTAAALLILLLGAKEMWQNFANPGCRDFVSFWSAARLAIAGTPALAYNPDALSHFQSAFVSCGQGNQMPFPYMPVFLLLVLPFGLLSYPVGMAVWVGVTLALYLLSVKHLTPQAGVLALTFPRCSSPWLSGRTASSPRRFLSPRPLISTGGHSLRGCLPAA